jgi:hypothetical protein
LTTHTSNKFREKRKIKETNEKPKQVIKSQTNAKKDHLREKNLGSKRKIKQDIAISTQIEHERHSTHKRGLYSIFIKRSHPQAYIYPKATKSIAIHLMSITSKVITSYLAYHGEQSI